jgi:hypothetical protein
MTLSVLKIIAANSPLPDIAPEKEYPLEINLDKGTAFDGDADDNFFLSPFIDQVEHFTSKKYTSTLDWVYYTDGRARNVISIIKSIIQHTDTVELWNFWCGYLEDDERPIIKTTIVHIAELMPKDIQNWDNQEVWKTPSRSGDRPTFYCLRIIR